MDKIKICCEERGQLGNKMFQVAAGVALALRIGGEFVKTKNNSIHDSSANEVVWKKIPEYTGPLNFEPYREAQHHYKQIAPPGKDTILMGYFQSCLYFEEYKQNILDLFLPTAETDQKVNDLLSKHTNTDKTCALHVRRGDYLNYPEHHPTQEVSYYQEAATFFPKDTLFVICSDDILWCRKNLTFLQNKVFVEGNKNYEDLYLMASCQHNIIANSTFSWWSAYLNKNPQKKVIAPKLVVGKKLSHLNTKDFYCKDWHVI